MTASVIIILSLIACDKRTQSNNSVEELSSSNYVQTETYTDCGPSSMPSSSSEVISNSEMSSSLEQSSLQSSSEVAPSSEQSSMVSSEVISSSSDMSSASESSIPSSSTPEGYYHVVFQNYDETILYEVDVEEGHEAIYVGETPTREDEDGFTFTFSGWDQDLSSIVSDVITKATYTASDVGWGPIIWF